MSVQQLSVMGARIAKLISIPVQLNTGESLSDNLREDIEDDFDHICAALGIELADFGKDEAYEDMPNLIEFLQDKIKEQDVPQWLVCAEIVIPRNVTKSGDDYEYSSYGWGYVRCVWVAGSDFAEIFKAISDEREKLFQSVIQKESTVRK